MADAATAGAIARRPAAEKDEPTHFGGPFGAVAFTVLLPVLTMYLWLCIHENGGALFLPSPEMLAKVPAPTVRGSVYFFGWLAFQAALDVLLPAKRVLGLAQRDGKKIEYRLNGFTSLWVSLAAVVALGFSGVVTGADVLAETGPMLSAATLFAYGFSAFLYAYGFLSDRVEHRTGLVIYDFFMGSSLNPRIGRSFDLKLFFESKIGLTTWIAFDLAMAHAEYTREGAVSLPMLLVCAFQLWYVADFYWFEEAMLSTWDINFENYGFMLAFGFIVWMPFTFSIQTQYLVYHAPEIPAWAAVLIGLMNFAGYYVFRSSNLQKHHFRTDPNARIWGKPPTFLQTKRGTKLLTSGWWGLARHTNYFGDLTMALAWCLPCGFSHVAAYFYFIYFAPLLIDRERRDHRECAKKYGDDWKTYCEKVKYRIVPGLY
jgi:protein-S-isoprenylcysteine O-methyltransferase Ste14